MNSKSPDTLEADQQEISNIVVLGYDSGDRSTVHNKKYEWNRMVFRIFIRSRIEPYPDRIKAIRYLNGEVRLYVDSNACHGGNATRIMRRRLLHQTFDSI
jgi:FMN phosphatase YigB (HAD superfamily)